MVKQCTTFLKNLCRAKCSFPFQEIREITAPGNTQDYCTNYNSTSFNGHIINASQKILK